MWWKYYLLFSMTTFVIAVNANLPDPLGIAADIINDHDKRLCDFEKAVGLPSCQTWPPLPAGISKSSTTTPTSTEAETTQKSDKSPMEITSRFGLPPQQILQRAASPPQLIQLNHQSLTKHLYLLEQGRPTEYGNIPQQTYQAQTAAEYPATHQRVRQAPFPEQRVPNRIVAGQQLQQQPHLQQQQQQQLLQQQQQLQQQPQQQQQQQLRPQRRLAAQTQLPHLKTMPHQLPPIQFQNGPEAINKGFNTKLHQLISTYNPNLNVVYSPISLQAALALIYTGATGQTAQELQTALDLPANKIQVLEMFQSIPKSRQSGEFTLNMLGRLFYNQNLRVVPQFVANAREYFDSDVTPVNFANPQVAANQINQWVAQRTNHRIRDLIAPQTLDPRTSAMLVNAVYFKAKWFNEFSSDETTNDEFFVSPNQPVPVRMMNNEDTFRYAELPDYHAKVLQLPYKDTDMSMLIILPYEVNGLAAMENRFQNVDLRRLLREVKPETVRVQLPKFRVEFDLDMVEALKRLNIKMLFSNDAELQGIFENQATGISSIRQKAFIDVNEAGSEAAAVTYTKFIPLSLPSNLKEFRADHPFMFAIVSPQAVYFAGHVVRF